MCPKVHILLWGFMAFPVFLERLLNLRLSQLLWSEILGNLIWRRFIDLERLSTQESKLAHGGTSQHQITDSFEQISQKDSWSTPHLVASPQHTQGALVNQVISLIVLDVLECIALHTINGNRIKRSGASSYMYHWAVPSFYRMHMECVPSSLYE